MIFPHPLLSKKDGFLAYGGDLLPETILTAYRWGIFPWYSEPPILWWFTHPRCVLIPKKVKISKSMRSFLKKNTLHITTDQCFEKVVKECAQVKRQGQETTWISEEIIEAYSNMHKLGYAHSIEVWDDNVLVGGLYGLALGKIFYGESMFSKVSNASKYALISLCDILDCKGFHLIDCQQETNHIISMGAELFSKEKFFKKIKNNFQFEDLVGKWVQK
ncbi:MAG: leucyl/phenylalanyl-tRNA--protein transferase [Saprospiraceae bacterium]